MKIKSHYLSILEPFLLEVLCLRIFFSNVNVIVVLRARTCENKDW